MLSPRVSVLILNWNGWRDTVECLESVFLLEYDNYDVIVCDNASTDGSVEKLRLWAEGKLPSAEPSSQQLRGLSYPPAPKPIPHAVVAAEEIAKNFQTNERGLTLIETGANLGYAGGNNIGLRYALRRADCDYVWLLNNDTVVERSALAKLIETITRRPRVGMCGSTLRYYAYPSKVQTLGGGAYQKWIARPVLIGKGSPATIPPRVSQVEKEMQYVAGASLLVSREFLECIGLMSEEYFLYFEELDWATRGKSRFKLAYSASSIVYHKEGATIGTNTLARYPSPLADMYYTRNRILFTRRYHPTALLACALIVVAGIIRRILDGRWSNLLAVVHGTASALRAPKRN